ncbi:MAG: hypothetical protein AAB822_02340 [Patescibacteria group bacterium]
MLAKFEFKKTYILNNKEDVERFLINNGYCGLEELLENLPISLDLEGEFLDHATYSVEYSRKWHGFVVMKRDEMETIECIRSFLSEVSIFQAQLLALIT